MPCATDELEIATLPDARADSEKKHEKDTTALCCNAHVLSGEIATGDVTKQESPPPVQSGSSGPSGPSIPSIKVSSSAAPLL